MSKKLKRTKKNISISKKFDSSIVKHYEGNNDLIPKFKIINSPSYAKVIMHLKKNQTVFCNYAALNYMDSSVKVNTKTGGIISGLIRSLFTDTSMYQNYFTGTTDEESMISFSSFLPGDIIAMKIKPGETFIIAENGFLAATENILVSTTTKFKNIFTNSPIVMNEISIDKNSNKDGMVWIASYGGFDKIIIDAGKKIKVDSGLFAFANKKYDYTLSTIGNIKSIIFSGHNIMMEFEGPSEIYVRSNNVNKLANFILTKAKQQFSSNKTKKN